MFLESAPRRRQGEVASRALATGEENGRRFSDEIGAAQDRVRGAGDAGDAGLGRVVPSDEARVLRAAQRAPQLLAGIQQWAHGLARHVGAHRTKALALPHFVNAAFTKWSVANGPVSGSRRMGFHPVVPYGARDRARIVDREE